MPIPRPPRRELPGRLVLLTTLVLLGLAGGCRRPPGKELQAGSYRAVLELPGGRELPFGLDVAREERGPVLYLLNGDERVRVDEVEAGEGRLRARMPGYETTLDAGIAGGELDGTVTLVHGGGRTLELPFRARLGELWRFERKPLADNADVAGRWALRPRGTSGVRGVVEFAQRFHEVTALVATPNGGPGLLAGDVHDERVRLSRFDGGEAVLLEAELDARGTLVGELWSDRGGGHRFVAARDPDADSDAVVARSRLSATDAPFAFAFPDVDGKVVSSTDPALAGRPMLIAITASWSRGAHQQAALLVDLDRRYRDRGLAIVALMFEQHRDPDRAVAAVRRFRAAHGVQFPTLIAGEAAPGAIQTALPQVESLGAYPTALFVDRTGRVRQVSTGFAGPAAGLRHERLVQEYLGAVEALLAGESGLDPG